MSDTIKQLLDKLALLLKQQPPDAAKQAMATIQREDKETKH